MRLTTLPEQLRKRGLTVVTHGEWSTTGSESFHPKGVVCHHTGPWSTVLGMVELCTKGRADLPGPLCQIVLAPDGACHVIAAGRANHAGAGGWRGLTGNSSVVGIEAMHSGAKGMPWPEAQRSAYARCAAAICDLLGVNESAVCGHKEWAPGRKVDPAGIDMEKFRAEVAVILSGWQRAGAQPAAVAPPVTMEVRPRLNFKVEGTVVDALKAPTGGVWVLTDIGAVYAFECEDIDAPNRHPEYWPPTFKAARMEPLGNGFTVIRDNGSRYEYPSRL